MQATEGWSEVLSVNPAGVNYWLKYKHQHSWWDLNRSQILIRLYSNVLIQLLLSLKEPVKSALTWEKAEK